MLGWSVGSLIDAGLLDSYRYDAPKYAVLLHNVVSGTFPQNKSGAETSPTSPDRLPGIRAHPRRGPHQTRCQVISIAHSWATPKIARLTAPSAALLVGLVDSLSPATRFPIKGARLLKFHSSALSSNSTTPRQRTRKPETPIRRQTKRRVQTMAQTKRA